MHTCHCAGTAGFPPKRIKVADRAVLKKLVTLKKNKKCGIYLRLARLTAPKAVLKGPWLVASWCLSILLIGAVVKGFIYDAGFIA